MFADLERSGVPEVHSFHDPASGLRAFIAIHSTALGPAVGGCRCLPYPDERSALTDALRLASGMSYKAALAGLALGGGKSVVMQPDGDYDRPALYRAFGRAVDSLGGRYIAAVDSGTQLDDLDEVASQTGHVWGNHVDGLDPSPLTVDGVLACLQTALQHQLGRNDVAGLHCAIQGVGHVGATLARRLSAAGARLTLADADAGRVRQLAAELGAETVAADAIYAVSCDAFLPCALGGVLNANTIEQLATRLIVGSANNQLAEPEDAHRLHGRGITYVPDYLANAGGLICLAMGHAGEGHQRINQRVAAIGNTLADILRDADAQGVTPSEMADRHAEQRLAGGGMMR